MHTHNIIRLLVRAPLQQQADGLCMTIVSRQDKRGVALLQWGRDGILQGQRGMPKGVVQGGEGLGNYMKESIKL